jgi:hypothetical protein
MVFPLDEGSKASRRTAAREHKRETLDSVIADLIVRRLIALDIILERTRHRQAQEDLIELLDQDVNPAMLDAIFSDNPLLFHDVTVDKKYQMYLRSEDRMTAALKKVILFAYDYDIDHKVLAKKQIGCRNFILAMVNQYEFGERMRGASLSRRNPVNRRKTYYAFARRIP